MIPYGHSIKGRIYFDPSNPDGCRAFGEFDFHREDSSVRPDVTPIIVVERGNCSFVQKVRNIEHSGGAAGVVVDSKAEDVSYVIMSDDGTGSGIRIPSMLVGKRDGQKFMDFVQEYAFMPGGGTRKSGDDDGDDEMETNDDWKTPDREPTEAEKKKNDIFEQSLISIKFNMDKPDNRVEYDIWFTSTDDRALDFVDNFEEYDRFLGKKVLMTPHYVTFECNSCDDEFKKKECYGNGKYCAINHKDIKLDGIEILNEDLRQKCIYNNSLSASADVSPQIFWDYIKRIHSICPKYINEDCSRNTHKDLGIDYKTTMECVK